MSHQCEHQWGSGRRCRNRIADPGQTRCASHRDYSNVGRDAPVVLPSSCQMVQEAPGAWRCRTHGSISPEWAAAIAMGARPPCRIPLPKPEIRKLAARVPLDRTTLEILLAHPDYLRDMDTEMNLSRNPSMPSDILERLLAQDVFQYRLFVGNPAVPEWLLRQLATGPDDQRCRVAGNPSTPPDILDRLASDQSKHPRRWVAENPSAPEAVLQRLARDPDPDVRSLMPFWDWMPLSVLEILSHDEDEQIRKGAQKALQKRRS